MSREQIDNAMIQADRMLEVQTALDELRQAEFMANIDRIDDIILPAKRRNTFVQDNAIILESFAVPVRYDD